MSIQGDGYHPGHDPFGRRFDGGYHPEMAAVAGTEILPGYRAILEGIQCDQEYAKCIFGLNHFYNRKQCCHYCGVIQWTSRVPAVGEPNDPNDLYTNFSADEHRKKQFLEWYTWSIIISFFLGMLTFLNQLFFLIGLLDLQGLWTCQHSSSFMGNQHCVGSLVFPQTVS